MGFGEGGLKGFLARATMQDSTLKDRGYKQKGVGGATDSDTWETPDEETVSGTKARTISATTARNVHNNKNDVKKEFPSKEISTETIRNKAKEIERNLRP